VAVISSDLAEVMTVSDRVIVMRQGRVVDRCEGSRMRPERILAAAIGAPMEEGPDSVPDSVKPDSAKTVS
jgi:rhamnose transport system ATP-binding protein